MPPDSRAARQARGLVAYAYSITGEIRFLTAVSPKARTAIRELAKSLGANAQEVMEFLDAWRDKTAPHKKNTSP